MKFWKSPKNTLIAVSSFVEMSRNAPGNKTAEPNRPPTKQQTTQNNASRTAELSRPAKRSAPAPIPNNSTKLNQKDMDSSCYRLSRVPEKYTKANKAIKGNINQSYAVGYYSENPVDDRPPKEKLEEIEARLGESNNDDEKFTLLVQKKSLSIMEYGENSKEAANAATELGSFYNQTGHSESALRNLNKAQQNDGTSKLEGDDALAFNVELADANLNAKPPNKQDCAKQLNAADKALSPFAEAETEDNKLSYRRYLLLARIKSRKRKHQDADGFFDKAIDLGPSVIEGGKETVEMAYLYEEAAINAEKLEENSSEQEQDTEVDGEKPKGKERIQHLYKEAYDIYSALDLEEDKKRIEPHLANENSNNEEGRYEADERKPEPEIADNTEDNEQNPDQ